MPLNTKNEGLVFFSFSEGARLGGLLENFFCDKKGKTQVLPPSLPSLLLALCGDTGRSCSSYLATMRKKPKESQK